MTQLVIVADVEAGRLTCRLAGAYADGLDVVTKAGGFGDRDALLRCLRDTAARAGITEEGATP